ncbi:MAG: 3-isopropylmalate dehydratase small subunit, partial [Muribaculaceae bacterium]|nr:3-isopropylmalate dehydratase small subunit [Muribaculaceae bacterium]
VSEEFLEELFDSIKKDPETEVTVDLPRQAVRNEATGREEKFDINPYKKLCLENGLDDIDYLMTRRADIEAFEKK